MVDFSLSDEQELIRQTAREFAIKELMPQAQARDEHGTFPTAELRKLAELGLMGVNVPAELGGAEAGVVAYSVAITELAKACAATTVAVAVTNMVAEVICAYGTEAQREHHVTRLTGGEYTAGAFALSEPHCGSDATALKATARRESGSWILNGTKQWITSGDHAGVIVVWARTNARPGAAGISAFLVPQGAEGMTVGPHERKMGLRGSTTVPLIFEDCALAEDALLGQEGQGFKIAMAALDGGRVGVASQALGIGRRALDEALRYARDRQAFGRPLGHLQAIQNMIADSATELDAVQLLTLRAALLKERKLPFAREASMAKLYSAEAANRVCARSLQIHGGYGYTVDYPVERLYRDARVTTIYEGTSEIQRLVIGRSACER